MRGERIARATEESDPMPRPMPLKDIDCFFARLSARDPAPKGELDHINAYTLLVAVVLSAQATDVGVNKATGPLFNAKAKNVISLSQRLLDDHDGAVPTDRESLESLPGVGRKTANVVLNMAFGQPTIAVDTHLFRVANRTGMGAGKTPLAVEKALERRIPAHWKNHAHHWLILHGRYICKARKPACPECPVDDLCRFKDKTSA